MHAKMKGTLGELKIMADLVYQDYPVFVDVGDNSRVDIITLIDNVPIKIQVKSVTSKNNVVSLKMSKSGPNYQYKYTKEDFDVMGVYILDEDKIAYVSSRWFLDKGTNLNLRLKPSSNNQKVGCYFYEDFRDIREALKDFVPSDFN